MSIEIPIIQTQKTPGLWEQLNKYFGNRKIDILEIGVYKAAQIQNAYKYVSVNSYTGVDPYLGDKADPYLGAYWKSELEAFNIYNQSLNIFEKYNAKLLKTTSEIYYRGSDRMYDFIYIDGNHNFFPALSDMSHWYRRLKPGGVLGVDDYGNSDTPGVTNAVNAFLDCYQEYIDRVDESIHWFKNQGKHIPICNKKICVYSNDKACDISKKNIYLWGSGKKAKEFYTKHSGEIHIEGFLDNYRKDSTWEGIPRVEIEAVNLDDSIIVLTLNSANYKAVAEQLRNQELVEGKNFIGPEVFEIIYLQKWHY